MQRLERTTFETPRAGEYLSVSGLRKQTGQGPERSAEVAIKELADNALDACEYAEVVPQVSIRVMKGSVGGLLSIGVTDNGPGIKPSMIEKTLNFDTRTSDKAAYRSPTRGAQGNALKTVLGMPHALGSDTPLILRARGIEHRIKVWADPAGELRKTHQTGSSAKTSGTQVELAIPAARQEFDKETLRYWGRAISVFNPHAFVKIDGSGLDAKLAQSGGAEVADFYKPTTDKQSKYTPRAPTSAHWYTTSDLKALVFSHIADARRGGRDLPLGKFVRQFKGISGTPKAKAVCAHLPEIFHLSDFEDQEDKVAYLLDRMKWYSTPPPHKALGWLGREHIKRRLEEFYGPLQRFEHKFLKSYLPSGLAYTFEFAVAQTDGMLGDLFFGVNYSPTFGDPLQDVRFVAPKCESTGIRQFLLDTFAHPRHVTHGDTDVASPRTAVVAHIVTPAPLFMEYGKTKLDMGGR